MAGLLTCPAIHTSPSAAYTCLLNLWLRRSLTEPALVLASQVYTNRHSSGVRRQAIVELTLKFPTDKIRRAQHESSTDY